MAKRINPLEGSLWDKILAFALPLAATSIIQQLFNSCDVATVGQFSGSHSLAAVGSTAPITNLLWNDDCQVEITHFFDFRFFRFFILFCFLNQGHRTRNFYTDLSAVGHSVIRGLVTSGQWFRRKFLCLWSWIKSLE